jgi:RNA polymerase sigma factor (TIGR02999 family)
MSASPGEITILLSKLDDPESLQTLMRLVYNDLHQMAKTHLRKEFVARSLQPTALVNEAYISLMQSGVAFPDRTYFFGAASQAMFRILVNRARERSAQKRGGTWVKVDLDEAILGATQDPLSVLALEQAMTQLEAVNPRYRRIIELRVFGGFTAAESAEILGMSEATLRRDWSRAKAWLRKHMQDHLDGPPQEPPQE